MGVEDHNKHLETDKHKEKMSKNKIKKLIVDLY